MYCFRTMLSLGLKQQHYNTYHENHVGLTCATCYDINKLVTSICFYIIPSFLGFVFYEMNSVGIMEHYFQTVLNHV